MILFGTVSSMRLLPQAIAAKELAAQRGQGRPG
jgi:hypothetical protein